MTIPYLNTLGLLGIGVFWDYVEKKKNLQIFFFFCNIESLIQKLIIIKPDCKKKLIIIKILVCMKILKIFNCKKP